MTFLWMKTRNKQLTKTLKIPKKLILTKLMKAKIVTSHKISLHKMRRLEEVV